MSEASLDPIPEQHLQQAQHNAKIAPSLDKAAPDWALTIRFYAALHWARAYLISKGQTTKSHLATLNALGALADHGLFSRKALRRYKFLYGLSLEARYNFLPLQKASLKIPMAQKALEEVQREVSQRLPI